MEHTNITTKLKMEFFYKSNWRAKQKKFGVGIDRLIKREVQLINLKSLLYKNPSLLLTCFWKQLKNKTIVNIKRVF